MLLSAPSISVQAQNALLKLLEEMRENTHFYFFLPSGTRLLETLLSRCFVVESVGAGEISEYFRTFISAKPKERLKND